MTILIDTNVKIMATGNQDYSILEKVYFKIGSWIELNIMYLICDCALLLTGIHSMRYNSLDGAFRVFRSHGMNLYWFIRMFSMQCLKVSTCLLLL